MLVIQDFQRFGTLLLNSKVNIQRYISANVVEAGSVNKDHIEIFVKIGQLGLACTKFALIYRNTFSAFIPGCVH